MARAGSGEQPWTAQLETHGEDALAVAQGVAGVERMAEGNATGAAFARECCNVEWWWKSRLMYDADGGRASCVNPTERKVRQRGQPGTLSWVVSRAAA